MSDIKLYCIESCDEEEGQVFWDIIPANSPDHAVEEWEIVRGDYATVIVTEPLHKFIATEAKNLDNLRDLQVDPLRAINEWEEMKQDVAD